eukprot:285438-Chlamydomonas_euryale.AAC.2
MGRRPGPACNLQGPFSCIWVCGCRQCFPVALSCRALPSTPSAFSTPLAPPPAWACRCSPGGPEAAVAGGAVWRAVVRGGGSGGGARVDTVRGGRAARAPQAGLVAFVQRGQEPWA